MKNIIYKMGLALGVGILLYIIYTIIKTTSGTSWVTSLTAPTVASETYQLETEGYNMRLYTFTHPKDKKKECMAIASSDGAGLTCWEK
jgi:predicted lipoprotein with Yx(FWY)xxD motif